MSINQPPGAASTSLLDRLVACVPYGTGGCRTGGRRRAVLPRVCEVSPSPSLGASAAAANMPRLFIVDHGRGGQFTHDRVGAERDALRAVRDTMDQHDNGWATVADILFQRRRFTTVASQVAVAVGVRRSFVKGSSRIFDLSAIEPTALLQPLQNKTPSILPDYAPSENSAGKLSES
jgi:hypothetical protein